MRLIKFHPIILCLLLVFNLTTNAFTHSYLSFQNSNNDSQHYEIIIALNCNECINCYYGSQDIFSEFDKTTTLFIVSGLPKREVPYFFEEKLNLQSENLHWIKNDSLFKYYSDKYNGLSAIYLLKNDEIVYSSDLKNIDRIKLKEVLQTSSTPKLMEAEEWDISYFGGDGNSTINFLNADSILIYNPVRNKIYLYSLSQKKMIKVFDIGVYPENIEEWLLLTELEENDLDFAKNDKEASEYINGLNRIIPGPPSVTNSYVFIPIELLAYDIILKEDNDTIVQLKWYSFLVQYNKELQYIDRYSFPYQFPDYPNHFNHLGNGDFLNDSIFYMKASTRVKDSIIAIYKIMPDSKPELIGFPPIGYPERFPMKVGAYGKVYYSQFFSETEYFFKEEPILYNSNTESSKEFSDWKYTHIGDSTRTGFWVENIFKIHDLYYVFGIENKSTAIKIYDSNFNLMHSEAVIDKPYFSIRLNGNTFYGLVSDDESIRIKSYTLIDE
ncbi:MAG: hypothetical protein IPG60_02495 [Bacteroidetes bacterium]|nr:hypothetical protein [Bacteroidota bacterium]